MELLGDMVAAVQGYVDTAKSYAFALSAILLISYPFFVLLWNWTTAAHAGEGQISGGSAPSRSGYALDAEASLSGHRSPAPSSSSSPGSSTSSSAPSSSGRRRAPVPLKGRVSGIEVRGDRGYASAPRVTCMAVVVLVAVLVAGVLQTRAALSFAAGALGIHGASGVLAADRGAAGAGAAPAGCHEVVAAAASGGDGQAGSPAGAPHRCTSQVARPPSSSSFGSALAAVGSAVAVLCVGASVARAEGAAGGERRSKKAKSMLRAGSGILRRCTSSKQVLCAGADQKAAGDLVLGIAPRYSAPPDAAESPWHHIELHVRNWLDEREQGLFQYVNEIPQGALQKFELQTKMPLNVIREDAKGSRRLKAFGRPFPFNYGCFPQTFRDPEELDEIHGAPGDGDPLDVLDLCPEAIGVGEIVRCRPLGAVCLIDEGQADWKILAVNVASSSPLASARSVADAERLMPGRVEQALRWMDQFKQHSSRRETTLHYHILEADHAVRIIEKDHAAWRRLVDSVGGDGRARGHWICHPSAVSSRRPPAKAVSVPLEETLACVRHSADRPVPAALAGTSLSRTSAPIAVQATLRPSLTMRRQNSSNSDSEMSSGGVSQGKSSGDEEKGSC